MKTCSIFDHQSNRKGRASHRSAALFELACLDCKNGAYAEALKKLDESIGLNKGHTKAQNMKAAVLRKLGCSSAQALAEENVRDDLLDLFAKTRNNQEFVQTVIKNRYV